MPLYEYACEICAHRFDIRHGADEKPELSCPQCQGPVKKVFHAAGIIFKGSGWHITDYAPKNSRPTEEKEKASVAAPSSDTPSTPPAPTQSEKPATPETK